MAKLPTIYVHLNKHRDGTGFIAVSRGSWSWMKLATSEAREVADRIHDLMDEVEGKK